MTSLAKQLQRLAVPHTQVVLGDDKKRASLLFEPREAANFDRETFHALGLNGIEELNNIDSNFEEFESVLFGEASLTFERSTQTKEINEKLNVNIQRFLIHLSPYCLLKPAHKALEWLIHRFNIHLYNTDELLLCFLPYHESKIFARVLQLVVFDSRLASKWDFLKPLQKNGLPLARSTLLNHCKTDLGFLSFVSDMVPKTMKVLSEKTSTPKCRVLFSFYATVVIGVLDAENVREELLGMLLPHISHGLKSKSVDYKASTYMILAQLLYKANLKADLLKTLLHVLIKGLVQDLLEEGVACVLLMFQTQEMKSLRIQRRTVKYLGRHHNLVKIISELSAQFDTDLFLSCFLLRLIPAAFNRAVGLATSGSDSDSGSGPVEYITLLHSLLSEVKIPDDIAENAACLFLEKYVSHGNKYLEEDVDDQIKDSLQGIVRQLEGKHSDAVDRAVQKVLSTCKNQHDRDLVQEFLNLYVLSVPHHLVTDSETSLVLSLNHRLPSVRQKAITTLVANRHWMDDNVLLKDSLSLRLIDEEPSVVLAALAIDKDIWSVMEDDLVVIDLLKKIVMKGLDSETWLEAATMATKISGMYTGKHQLEVINSYLPCFFLLDGKKIAVGETLVNTLLKSIFASGNTLLKAVAKEMKNVKQLFASGKIGDINHRLAISIAKGLCENLDDENMETIASWVTLAVGHKDMSIVYLMVIVLDEMVAMATDVNMKLTLCVQQIQLITKTKKAKGLHKDSCDMKDLTQTWGMLMSKEKLSPKTLSNVMCLKGLHSIVNLMKLPAQLLKDTFWHLRGDRGEEDLLLQVAVQLYDMLLEITMTTGSSCASVGTFRAIFKQMEQVCFSDSANYLKFMGMLWTQHTNDLADDVGLTLTLQARSLHLGLAYIKSLDKKKVNILLKSSSLVCNLLTVLMSEHTAIRMAAVQIAAELLAREDDRGSAFKPLLHKVVRCEGEMHSDASYIYQAVSSVFKSTSLDGRKSPHKVRSPRKSVGASPAKGEKQQCLAELLRTLVDESTPYFVQHSLLEVFLLLDNKDVLLMLLPLMSRLLKFHSQGGQPQLATECLNLILRRFTVNTSDSLSPGSESLGMFLTAIRQPGEATEEVLSPQTVALQQITREFYEQLNGGSQQKLLCTLFDVYVGTEDLSISSLIHKVLKHIAVDGNHIQQELKRCIKPSTAKTVREAKRQKVVKVGDVDSEVDVVTEFDSKDWQRATLVLEAVQNKKKIVNYTVLVPVCFELLASMLNSDHHMSAEYIKQLVLALLYNICSRLEKNDEGNMEDGESVPEEQFNMELIVNCIRSSDNPQTHHQALLLLTSAAKIFPEHLVHNIMSVFTFMGQSIMRQDDAYSFHIISKILETVIPALITACKQRKSSADDHEDLITMVIGVFVDSYPYIPNHRRHLLFHKLLQVIGGDNYLWRTLLLMMDMVVTKGTLKAELASEEADSGLHLSDMEFCLNLCAEFTPHVQFLSATEMINYLMKLPDEKEDTPGLKRPQQVPNKTKAEEAPLFDVAVHTDKQLRHFKYATIHLLISLFASNDLIAQISKQISEAGYQALTPNFQLVLETLLQLVSHVTKVTNRSNDKPTAKFWKALHHKAHDLLDKFVTLLPDTLFIVVIGGLIVSHNLPSIQRKALDLLNIKLQQQRQFTEAEAEALLSLVKQLVKLVQVQLLGKGITEEGSVNGQAAFISLKLLCRHIGVSHADDFIKVLKIAVNVFKKTQSMNISVCSCALLCVAEVCSTLKVPVIQELPKFMPALVDVMKDPDTLKQNELFLLSVVTTVNKVVENLAKFLSPYLLDILSSVCILSTKSSDSDVLQKSQVQIRLKAIRSTISNAVNSRVLLPAVTKCYKALVEGGELRSISSLMSLFGDHISQIPREDLIMQLNKLQSFFLQCLDLSTDHPELPASVLSDAEGVTIETIIDMVMKLSESTFKPFLFKLFDWATSSDEVNDRVLVFYRLAERLAERLRSLFTLFAGHIIGHVAKMLDSNNLAKNGDKFFASDKKLRKKSCQLLLYILDCVYKCCLYDTEGFVTRERFETVMQPLVDQVENTQGGEERYTERVSGHLVPCIVQLAVAAQDDSLWRTLNYQLCLTTRSQEPQVKLAALQVLDELHKKLGEDYMPLLPDAVPFLAELMEDESEEVEKKCHEVIREMEKTLGEPLQKYF